MLPLLIALASPSFAAEEADASTLYVQASTLNVREEPDGAIVGKLRINTAVTVITEQGDYLVIEGPDGVKGVVPFAYLSIEPLTLAEALSQAEAATDPAAKKSWAERAAALDPRDPRALELLAASHGAAGDGATAEALRARLRWPDDILVAGVPKGGQATRADTDGDGLPDWVERQLVFSDPEERGDPGVPAAEIADADGLDLTAAPRVQLQWTWAHSWDAPSWMQGLSLDDPLPKKAQRKLGIAPGDTVWVLPRKGPAVEGIVREARLRELTSCGEVNGVVLSVDAPLADKDHAVAFSKAPPPASWSSPAPTPQEVSKNELRALGYLIDVSESAELHVVAGPDGGAFVRAVDDRTPDAEVHSYWVVDLVVRGDKVTRGEAWEHRGMQPPEVPVSARDINGDGTLERVFEEDCGMRIVDEDGTVLTVAGANCCGC
ncbi:MAG: SH3 domain-containing protein [Deltaproteobacteria bacterium]|nr:MAG: SH3 domain-containing protein [Deltaproteobacteria bacterium]